MSNCGVHVCLITAVSQVELMLTLQRLTEHFAAAFFSTQQSRPLDAVGIITVGAIAAIAGECIHM